MKQSGLQNREGGNIYLTAQNEKLPLTMRALGFVSINQKTARRMLDLRSKATKQEIFK